MSLLREEGRERIEGEGLRNICIFGIRREEELEIEKVGVER